VPIRNRIQIGPLPKLTNLTKLTHTHARARRKERKTNNSGKHGTFGRVKSKSKIAETRRLGVGGKAYISTKEKERAR